MEKHIDDWKLEKQLCFPLYAASREMIKQYRPFLDAIDLTYTQYIAMLVFWEQKKLNVKELGKKLYLDSGTLTPVLKSLEAKGLVTRSRSKEDERVLIVEITEEGERLKKKADGIPNQVDQQSKLSREDTAELYRLLYQILE